MKARHSIRPALAAAAMWTLAAGAAGQSWIQFTDETATRLVGDPTVTADPYEKHLHAADVDLDGDLDLIVGRKNAFVFIGERSNVLFMNEGGVLVDRTSELIPSFLIASKTRDIRTVDGDGDGWPDIVEANTLYELPRYWRNLGQDGNGTFLGFVLDAQALATLDGQMVKFCSVSPADIDGDGDQDLYFNDYRNNLEDRMLVNDGTGVFLDETAAHMTPSAAYGSFVIDGEFADFNGDGAPDLLKVEDSTLPLRIIYNDGTGFFGDEQSLPTLRTHQALPADFDNDGRLDLYVVEDAQDAFYMNGGNDPQGHVQWTQVVVGPSPLTAGPGGQVSEADLDRDGYVDVLASDVDTFIESCTRRFAALRNATAEHPSETLEDPNAALQPWNVQGVHDAVAFDLDGDGFLDLVQGTCTGLKVWRMQPFPLPGTSYCTSEENSAGTAARVHAHGSASIAANDFRLVVEGGVPRQVGIFFYGPNQTQVPFGNGLRCVAGGTARLTPPIRMGASGGLAARRVDFTEAPANGGSGQILAGSTWNFQFWYRDPAAGGAFFDLSDATSVAFVQ